MAIKYKRKGLYGRPEGDTSSPGRFGRGRPDRAPAARRQPRSVLLMGLAASIVVYAVGRLAGGLPSTSELPVSTCRGTVVSKESRVLEGGGTEYAFVVEVAVGEGRTRRDTVPVTRESWDAVTSGAEVEVAYQLDEAKDLFRIVDLYAAPDSPQGLDPLDVTELRP